MCISFMITVISTVMIMSMSINIIILTAYQHLYQLSYYNYYSPPSPPPPSPPPPPTTTTTIYMNYYLPKLVVTATCHLIMHRKHT